MAGDGDAFLTLETGLHLPTGIPHAAIRLVGADILRGLPDRVVEIPLGNENTIGVADQD